MNDRVRQEVDHLFRRHAGRMAAALARVFGPDNLTLVEEVVQDSLVRALEIWPFHGIPANPTAWLIQVAKNRALDELRRRRTFDGKVAAMASELDAVEVIEPQTIADDQLRLMLVCCHPAIPREGRVALTLRTVGGLSIDEIGRAFLTQPATVAQRLVRAKRMIRARSLSFDLPPPGELRARVASLLEALYLIFTEGYSAAGGDVAIRHDLCNEAIRLTRLAASDERLASPAAHACLSLMLFQAARIPARASADGTLLTLEEQDRRLWDGGLVREAVEEFRVSIEGDEKSEYHIEAAIAMCHSTAPEYASTDWAAIVARYDDLLELTRSPIVRLNRAIALAMVAGPAAGLEEIDALASHPLLRNYYLLPAARAELLMRSGSFDAAAAEFQRALELPSNEAEKRVLGKKLARCRSRREALDRP